MSEKYPGKYFVIEGTDGAGTTTQKELLKDHLTQNGHKVIDFAEPGGTPIGDLLRVPIKDKAIERSPESNIDLFTICRRELVRQVIEPSAAAGIHSISDRNWFSTIAYQGFGEKADINLIVSRMKDALGQFFMPDFAVIIDVPVEISAERMKRRGTRANDYFEEKGPDFFQAVRDGYLWAAKEYNLPVVDGSKSIEKVQKGILALIDKAQLL